MAIVLNKKGSDPDKKWYPLAAIREGVVFPHVEMVLTFGRSKSVNAVNEAFTGKGTLVFVTQKRASINEPDMKDLYTIGVMAKIERTLKTNGEVNALIKGIERVRIKTIDDSSSYLQAEIDLLPDVITSGPDIEALSKHLLNEFKRAVNLGKNVEFLNFMKLMSGVDPAELVDQIATTLDISTAEKQEVLEIVDLKSRMEKVLNHLTHEIKVLEIERNIASKTQKKFDKNMREAVLRERLKTIQNELGEESDEEQDVVEFRKKIQKAGMPKVVKKKTLKELQRFSRLSVHSPEHSYIRSWLETVTEMPWNLRSESTVSIKRSQQVLDADHYGLEEVKERIIEYLSVLKLKKQQRTEQARRVPTILCFAGPPGVGKTSIGRSIAKALGREFVKVSLGGVRDEAEIRGHRRTYVGAMPGRIIQAIRDTGSKNPVFMLDEIDKLGADFRGDPSSALLEALDPEQNKEFSDHYLEVPFDLSEVIFITTANVIDQIPAALRDRLEIIRYAGYTEDEKYHIARRHLLEKTLKANGLKKSQVSLSPQALKVIIKNYTREAGVRNLEREVAKVMRKAAKMIVAEEAKKVEITQRNLHDFLGPEVFSDMVREKKDEVGLATGLAWTEVGGDIIFIEVALMPGKGNVVLTGKLGEVMQESAKAAWSYVRSHWDTLGLQPDFYKSIDVHVHVPEGAVPKDGPSAGVTMVTTMVSALTNRPVYKDVGMTGEITLRGRVLEIGGVKEKVIAAHRAGLKTLILPLANKKSLVKVPQSIQDDIDFHFVDSADQVLTIALKKAPAKTKNEDIGSPRLVH
jgi:ATP-dependent Lon protease